MEICVYYYTKFGSGDCSDTFDYTVELSDEETIDYIKTIINDESLESWFDSTDAYYTAYSEIEAIESENLEEMGDEFSDFDSGYDLVVYAPEIGEPDDGMLEEFVSFAKKIGDNELLESILNCCAEYYYGDDKYIVDEVEKRTEDE